jgi:hypothetical protein
MLRLPTRIEVQLTDTAGRPLREPALLIGINILSDGRYYFGNLIGLTNDSGVAAIEGVELELRYQEDRSRYPMDYKLELADCDELIEIVLLSAEELKQARDAVEEAAGIAHSIRTQYAAARNEKFSSALVRVSGDAPQGNSLKVSLPTNRA